MKSSFDATSVTINIDVIPDYVKSNDEKQANVIFFSNFFISSSMDDPIQR